MIAKIINLAEERERRQFDALDIFGRCEAITLKGRRCMNIASFLDEVPLTLATRDGHYACAAHMRARRVRWMKS